jgi:Cdc6-like AAA superfamily ATPase
MTGCFLRLTHRSLQFHKSMMFQSYQDDEIESILKEKVKGHSIVDPKAVSFIAKRVANVKGDARQAIEMLSTAITNAQERAEDQPNSGAQQKGPYLVGMKDVIKLCSDLSKLTEMIRYLPLMGKLVICAAVRLARENQSTGSTIKLTRRDLLNATYKLLQEKLPEDSVDESDINALISRLHDDGFANIETIWGVDDDDPIAFNHQVSDLEVAVEQTLKGSFFAA